MALPPSASVDYGHTREWQKQQYGAPPEAPMRRSEGSVSSGFVCDRMRDVAHTLMTIPRHENGPPRIAAGPPRYVVRMKKDSSGGRVRQSANSCRVLGSDRSRFQYKSRSAERRTQVPVCVPHKKIPEELSPGIASPKYPQRLPCSTPALPPPPRASDGSSPAPAPPPRPRRLFRTRSPAAAPSSPIARSAPC